MNVSRKLAERKCIPRIIWIFWSQGEEDAPMLVRKCIGSWKRHNPNWTVKVICAEDLNEFDKKIFENDLGKGMSLNHQSDLLRVYLLSLYGGVWVDATLFCNEPLDNWLPNYSISGFFAFYAPGKDREIASWLIASEQGHVITTKFYTEFKDYWANNRFRPFNRFQKKLLKIFNKMLNKDKRTTFLWFHPILTKVLKIYPYFIFHYQFYKLINENKKLKLIWDQTPKISANGPHLPTVLGLANSAGDKERELLTIDSSPVYKLNWRINNKMSDPNSILSFVLNNKK